MSRIRSDSNELYKTTEGYCYTCITWVVQSMELDTSELVFLEKILPSKLIKKLKQKLMLCNVCKSALEFIIQFAKMCERSQTTLEQWNPSDGPLVQQFECVDESVEQAFSTISSWVSLSMNQMCKIDEGMDYQFISLSGEDDIKEEPVEEYLEESEEESSYFMKEVKVEYDSSPESKSRQFRTNTLEETVASQYTCHYEHCDRVFQSTKALKTHFQRAHTKTEDKDESLMSQKITQEAFGCPESNCDFVCTSDLKLSRHLKSIHQAIVEKDYVCDTCGKFFRTKCRLKYHLNTHLGLSPYHCDFEGCNRSFRNPTRLRNHKQEFHLKIIRMHCAVCGKVVFF